MNLGKFLLGKCEEIDRALFNVGLINDLLFPLVYCTDGIFYLIRFDRMSIYFWRINHHSCLLSRHRRYMMTTTSTTTTHLNPPKFLLPYISLTIGGGGGLHYLLMTTSFQLRQRKNWIRTNQSINRISHSFATLSSPLSIYLQVTLSLTKDCLTRR